MHPRLTRAVAFVAASAMTLLPTYPACAQQSGVSSTKTPIKHVVVIFQENVSFDHYFGTYPHAFDLPGETPFHTKEDTAESNTLLSSGLLTHNPNKASTMGYYDGNTVTAMWNYAQNFAMSDNSWGTTFGPSTPGALNLIAGNTFPGTLFPTRPNGTPASASGNIANAATTGAVIGDPRPLLDDCVASNPKFQGVNQITVSGKNVGDLLNAKGISWGWFQGGFAPTAVDAQGRAVCGQHHTGLAGDDAVVNAGDYIPHHEPFMYYPQTTNQHHVRPSNPRLIGTSSDGANHQYDLTDFFAALSLRQHD